MVIRSVQAVLLDTPKSDSCPPTRSREIAVLQLAVLSSSYSKPNTANSWNFYNGLFRNASSCSRYRINRECHLSFIFADIFHYKSTMEDVGWITVPRIEKSFTFKVRQWYMVSIHFQSELLSQSRESQMLRLHRQLVLRCLSVSARLLRFARPFHLSQENLRIRRNVE